LCAPRSRQSWEVVVVAFGSQSASLGWLLFIEVWILVLWFGHRPPGRNPFGRRLDQLLVLLLPQVVTDRRATIAAFGQDTLSAFRGPVASGELRRSARRWRAQLGAVYAHGYQVASETISSSADVVHCGDLVRETVEALKAERTSGGATVRAAEDQVVVLAYGLGAWPSRADLTSLEELLGELAVSHGALRIRFESFLRTISHADQNRAFRELAGASFVLGAAARIVEAAEPPVRNVRPLGGSHPTQDASAMTRRR
jgi:hypothetical protein